MIDIIEKNLDQIINICIEMQVKELYLFGSAAKDDNFTNKSDLDFLYSFNKNHEGFPAGGYDYFDLMFKLEEITGRKIDLVALERINNRFFAERVNKEKIQLYAS